MSDTSTGWYPAAFRKNIEPGANDGRIVPALAVLHVAVSLTRSLFDFFLRRSGGIESHFYIRRDGTVEQYRNVLWEADANLGANSYQRGPFTYGAVSIETAGLALGWWNTAQKDAIKALLLWLHQMHGINLRPVNVDQPTPVEGGVSYHSRFPSWSPVKKSCPGPNRIKQYERVIVPWMDEQYREFLTVVEGESLTDLAARGGISVARMWRLNRDVPKPGEQVRVK